ncbi:putative acyl-CoA dehydrogenase [Acidocella aquatica]|uniref:Acyl-CoA dehydrogenase n=1 Tax=Acidocella aquatica TaxID=1922313 RepID=A0ABQ6ABA0_9PROT|nr:acyl-CoA dehydrogenase family protein [Acidocella aquatica]GLR68578.1 putative acyl-CoA dehydrogenase [Acidocella aquatica]
MSNPDPELTARLTRDVERFVREVVIPYETDPRRGPHGPLDSLVMELREKARAAGVLTPHIRPGGAHLTQRETAAILKKSGLSPLGPLACNTAAPDEGNMFLMGRVASAAQKAEFLQPVVEGRARSAFLMTEPAAEGGAGSDPSMLKTHAVRAGDEWVINGRKAFITGFDGAHTGIVMARTRDGERPAATMFLVRLPHPAISIERILDTIDSSMPGGHAVLNIENLRVPAANVLGEVDEGFKYAQVRLSPARLSHCMRWWGAAARAQEIASQYACTREAFGKKLIEHEGVGFMLAENLIALKQAELMIDWCADVLDTGESGTVESSMTKVAVSELLFAIADRCVQVMGGTGVTGDTIVEQVFREIRAFRIYDGPTEVHKWSLARKIRRDHAKRP